MAGGKIMLLSNPRRRVNKAPMKRRMKRYRKRSKPTAVVVSKPAGAVFADRYFTKVRYTFLTTLQGSMGTPFAYTQIRLNGAYDPVLAVGGGQPLGWDQLSALYLRYKVHFSKLHIRSTNLTAVPTYLVTYPLTSTSAPSGLESDMEQRYSKNILVSGAAGGGVGTLKTGMSVKRLFGQKELYDDNFEARTVGDNPVNQGIWNVACYTVDGATIPNMPVAITVEYFIEFTDPVRLGLS